MTGNQALTNKAFWDTFFGSSQQRIVQDVLFSNLFEKYLHHDPQKKVLEIGCAGGEFLCYLAKQYGFQAYGIDFSDKIDTTRKLFSYNGLPDPELSQADFFSWESPFQYDVVCSFGFAEHFADLPLVVQKHAEHVLPGGIMIITVPHFSGLQFLFHLLVDPQVFKHHNLKIMNLRSFKHALIHLPFRILHLSYYQCFGLVLGSKLENRWSRWWASQILKSKPLFKKALRYKPNPLVSPYIICIAQRYP